MHKKMKSGVALAVCCATMCSIVGCKNNDGSDSSGQTSLKQAEYNTTTASMPSNWNELTYMDNNDTQIMQYINSPFFDYDYKFQEDRKFDADGSINTAGIVRGAYTTNYSAATALEDVTSTVDGKWGYTQQQKEEGGYAWKITLRQDLKWDDGTPIKAEDFEYSMQQQLDPAFMNFRGNTYYDNLRLKNARGYFFQNQAGTYEKAASLGYTSNQQAIAAGQTLYIDAWGLAGAQGYLDGNGKACPQWLAYNDTVMYTDDGKTNSVSGKTLWEKYGEYIEVGAEYEHYAGVYVENALREVKWEDVGIYTVDEYSFVVCLDKAYALLQEDGGLSYQAAYYMQSLPLVKKSLYERCKKEPAAGATLKTTNYNTSLETTASWGPYKLAEFTSGSHYKLVKNPHWYGWNMELYKNQYNVSAINCTKMTEASTKWMAFLSGKLDEAALDAENIADYKDSKYVFYAPGTGTYGMQLFSNLSVLKNSKNNNGILAIDAFRQAISLGLNRNDVVETIWPGAAIPCLGVVNGEYFYDIENSADLQDRGIYRNTNEAKEGLLRAYGFTQDASGLWSSGDMKNLEMEDAYEALTGYNPTLAKQKMTEAVAELTANASKYGYNPAKNITLVYGAAVDNAKQHQRVAYLQGVLDNLTAGTALAGKIKIVLDASAGSGWADAFRNGDTQIGFGYGFSGNAFNPFDIIGGFVDSEANLNYHTYWDTDSVMMTLTMPEGNYAGAGERITMSLQNWYYCLNGLAADKKAPKTYNWDSGYAPANARLTVLAALEERVISKSHSIMLIGEYSGAFLGGKFQYISSDYNTFMGFGGVRYLQVNYTDSEWAAYVAAHNNDLSAEYKKTA
ncbi:MAG: hypothetical protein E7371_05680 [Clostridiales bacterium]|nr:hypothetical protein [Clostridiales bacterium]